MSTLALITSCEHGGHRVPPRYRDVLCDHELLASHAGYDPGALELARGLSRSLGAPLYACLVTRLLVDQNRSLGHPRLFSRWTRALPPAERQHIVESIYLPHRRRVEEAVARAAASQPVLHLAVHTFAPELGGLARTADVGLLYDPKRALERELSIAIQGRLPDLRVRRNYPYLGVSDGLTTHLRTRHPDRRYAGIELEVNQVLATVASRRRDLIAALAQALLSVL